MELTEIIGWQFVNTINLLSDGLDEQGDPVNCCPICCGPCAALLAALNRPSHLHLINGYIRKTGYNTDGWDFWSELEDGLHVGDIKAMWFNEDGSHKSVCMSSNGVNTSEELHRMIREDIADRQMAQMLDVGETRLKAEMYEDRESS
jgi:hypothetical protein